ncbi:hypothetical protein Z584_03076 [Mycobacterium tuberculosis variant bovis B2 7505]|nr:hypothetical protein Z584_03076 [Mycobacterium tuberculosis variant bovis B2 7505]
MSWYSGNQLTPWVFRLSRSIVERGHRIDADWFGTDDQHDIAEVDVVALRG